MATNFSHRIHQLSFGIPTKGLVYSLEGELHVANESKRYELYFQTIQNNIVYKLCTYNLLIKMTVIGDVSYKYFIDVVATDVKSHSNEIKTYQYSAKDIQRIINHTSGW